MLMNDSSIRDRKYTDTLQVLEKYKRFCGITRLADLSDLDYSQLAVYTAIRPKAKSLSTSQGKGNTREAAKCSALMESIEVHFAEILTPELYCSEEELNSKKCRFVTPNNLNTSIRYNNSSEKMHWITAEILIAQQKVLVPFAEFSLDSYLKEVLIYSPSSTGLAGGNTYREALLHSLLEIIEREDNEFLPLEVIGIQNNLVLCIADYFEIKVLYKRNSYNLPSFEVFLKSKIPFENQILFKGSGCHLDKNIALNRAITEAVQSRVTLIAGSRDDLVDTKYVADSEWSVEHDKINYESLPMQTIDDIDDGLNFIYKKVSECGQDIIIYKYFEEDICILKSKILSRDSIQNV